MSPQESILASLLATGLLYKEKIDITAEDLGLHDLDLLLIDQVNNA